MAKVLGVYYPTLPPYLPTYLPTYLITYQRQESNFKSYFACHNLPFTWKSRCHILQQMLLHLHYQLTKNGRGGWICRVSVGQRRVLIYRVSFPKPCLPCGNHFISHCVSICLNLMSFERFRTYIPLARHTVNTLTRVRKQRHVASSACIATGVIGNSAPIISSESA